MCHHPSCTYRNRKMHRSRVEIFRGKLLIRAESFHSLTSLSMCLSPTWGDPDIWISGFWEFPRPAIFSSRFCTRDTNIDTWSSRSLLWRSSWWERACGKDWNILCTNETSSLIVLWGQNSKRDTTLPTNVYTAHTHTHQHTYIHIDTCAHI